jgi:hypothetical protein
MMLQFAFGPGLTSAKPSSGPAEQASGTVACEASPLQMLALAAAASAWWESRRPDGWTLEQHLAEPIAGCNGTAQEVVLAEAVEHWVGQRD